MKRLKIVGEPYPTKNGCCSTFTNLLEAKDCIIVTIDTELAKKHSRIEIEGLLIHEGVHVYQKALEWMGEDDPGIEMEAYAIQSITMQLINAYEETVGWKDDRT